MNLTVNRSLFQPLTPPHPATEKNLMHLKQQENAGRQNGKRTSGDTCTIQGKKLRSHNRPQTAACWNGIKQGCVWYYGHFMLGLLVKVGRRGWIKIGLPLCVPRGTLSLSSCTLLPGRQTVKTPSQKDVLSFVTRITVRARVTRDSIFKCLFLSP